MVPFSGGLSFPVNQCPNINSVWASLIVEECVRLGLTYFCIAPGSRSSPLAISAATHPLTTCISCFDERSLAFHAVGYAKGSHKPAVIITSSGTAVSNLFPAVVEASQDFTPVLFLTADRPPELQAAGANQAINQVDHFGKFVRYFFCLPPPSDEIPARMVLTTIDSAIYNATQVPRGPVHVNCPFREPLDDCPTEWALDCLHGLDRWISDSRPYTTYINLQNVCACNEPQSQAAPVVQVIQNADRGLLLVGAIESEDEIWAVLLMAKHLSWPVVTDILSGLRLRKVLSSFPQNENQILFIDHLDHALLSDFIKSWPLPDVILQLGSRITSKRVAQLLDTCTPCSYILVEKHPCRHDPLHLVTHRIQSTISVFVQTLLKIEFNGRKAARWRFFLQAIETSVALELSIQIDMEDALTEPYVAHAIVSSLQGDAALFVGNSMVIRDVDMYGKGSIEFASDVVHLLSNQKFSYQGIRVAGNRGASGIDGLVSSAIGFAAGCNKRVLCVIGDVSFLHDTNGLAILNERMQRKPVTILVINNHGGAIFSLLPIAERTQPKVLQKYFYTSHDISIGKLCAAHSIKHLYVHTKMELQHALFESQQSHTDCIIEVESSIPDNSTFHSILRNSARQAANQAFSTLLISDDTYADASFFRIMRMEYSLYRIQLSARPTTSIADDGSNFYREGFVLSLTLDDGSVGFGEVVPTEIHKEDLIDVEEQLLFLLHTIESSEICCPLPLLNGSFSSWFWTSFGIKPSSLFPSVRCGFEMAVLHALANKWDSTLSDIILGLGNPLRTRFHSKSTETKNMKGSTFVQICALVNCDGTPKEVAFVVCKLVEEGFHTIKLKVARRANPIEDAAVIQEIRNTVGYRINIRVDANRKWSYEEAVIFGSYAKNFELQYIEEPVQCEEDIIKFCEETSLPVALDETIDDLKGNMFNKLKEFAHPRIVAIVIKPSVVGGFEMATMIARWAQQHEKMVVISSTYESSLSLSAYVQFAHYLELQKASLCQMRRIEVSPAAAHGLGTYKWLKEDVAIKRLSTYVHQLGDTIGVSVEDAASIIHNFLIDKKTIGRSNSGGHVRSYWSNINAEDFSWSVRILETKMGLDNKVVVFLHGFLGTSEEWVPTMKALSANARCISIDLPGHGQSHINRRKQHDENAELDLSVESVGDMLHELLCGITTGKVVLVGYSMGARIALYLSLKYNHKIEGAVLISGSPGLRDQSLRKFRTAQDDAKSRYLSIHGLKGFLEIWYAGKLWNSLRDHPHFEQIIRSRKNHQDIHGVAKALSDLSVGRQRPLWEDLRQCKTPLLLIVGENDKKFKGIAQQMCSEINQRGVEGHIASEKLCHMVEVSGCGHAVHLESPLDVINIISRFLRKCCDELFPR